MWILVGIRYISSGEHSGSCGAWRLHAFVGDWRMTRFVHRGAGGRRWWVVSSMARERVSAMRERVSAKRERECFKGFETLAQGFETLAQGFKTLKI